MVLLKSRWPGKCRVCDERHLAGDLVWWDKHTKGVTCVTCHNKGNPPKGVEVPIDTEGDDLKVAKPTTLKVGHRLAIGTEKLPDLFGCAFHDTNLCDCPGCFVVRGGYPGGGFTRRQYKLVRIVAASALRNYGPCLYAPASAADRAAHIEACRPYYMVQFAFAKSTETPIVIQAQVPLPYIDNFVGDGAKLAIMAGAPDLTLICVDDLRLGEIAYINGAGSRSQPLPEWPMNSDLRMADGSTIDLHCLPVDYDNISFLTDAELSPVAYRGSMLRGFVDSGHASQMGCNCSRCERNDKFSKERSATDVFRITHAYDYGKTVQAWVTIKGPEGDNFPAIPIRLPKSMDTNSIISTTGLAFSRLSPELVRSGMPIPMQASNTPDEGPTPNVPNHTKEGAGVPDNLNLNEAATSLIAALQASSVPETRVREIALEMIGTELKKVPVKNHKIRFNEGAPIEFDGILHGMATEIAEAIVSGFHNIMVVGPAGSGKTYLFSQVAKILQKQMGWDENDYKASMSCAPGQTESMFIGRMIPSLTTGTESYHGTNLTRLYSKECGGAFLFDEISNSEPTVMNLVNSMIALDGHVTLPDGRILERPAKMVIFAADNTWGQGGDRLYIRNQLDAATLDRFTGAKFYMDYDEKLERAICPITEVYEAVSALRQKVTSLKLRRIVSTRAFAAAQRMGANGMKTKEIVKRLTIDWSENDRKSVGA